MLHPKDHPESGEAGKRAKADADTPVPAPADADAPGNAEVQRRVDKETEQGFRGVEVDLTDNAAYSVTGVTTGQPTPETDPAQADEVARHARGLTTTGDGPGPR